MFSFTAEKLCLSKILFSYPVRSLICCCKIWFAAKFSSSCFFRTTTCVVTIKFKMSYYLFSQFKHLTYFLCCTMNSFQCVFLHFTQHLNSFGAVQTNVTNKTTSNQQLLLMYFCIQSRNNHQDQFHNLSDCALCSLPFFLMVTGSSRKPPLTPFEATSCRETSWGAHSLKSHQAGEQYRNKG